MGDKQNQPFQLPFNGSLKVDFQAPWVTSDGGLILVRDLDERRDGLPSPGPALRQKPVPGAEGSVLVAPYSLRYSPRHLDRCGPRSGSMKLVIRSV